MSYQDSNPDNLFNKPNDMAKKNNDPQEKKQAMQSLFIDFFNPENNIPYTNKQVYSTRVASTPKKRAHVVETL